ncbi:MAG: tetratricopeptide repeat protein [Candidatus Eiseniibacteriota bacterium]
MKRFSTRDAAKILEVSEDQIRTYARLGEIVPLRGAGGRLEFEFHHLLLLKTTRGLLEAGVPARRLRRIWTSLRRQLTSDLPLTSITIYADGDRAIAWDGSARWQPDSGQFLLNFDAAEMAELAGGDTPEESAPAARVEFGLVESVEPHARAAPAARHGVATLEDRGTSPFTAEQWFHLGCELESRSSLEARQAYLQAIELDPDFGDAHLNLGRLEHEAGELGRAEAQYREAVRCTPEDSTCHFNLGVLLEDRGRAEEAILAYRRVIDLDPDSADAHYNLGLLLETHGRKSEAMRHLMTARRLYGPSGRDSE